MNNFKKILQSLSTIERKVLHKVLSLVAVMSMSWYESGFLVTSPPASSSPKCNRSLHPRRVTSPPMTHLVANVITILSIVIECLII